MYQVFLTHCNYNVVTVSHIVYDGENSFVLE
jgi:hypothetical protein